MCTMWIDGFNGIAHHVAQNVDLAIVAAADLPALRAHARNRRWTNLRLLSAGSSTFKYDLGSEDAEGDQDSTVHTVPRRGDLRLNHPAGHELRLRRETLELSADGQQLIVFLPADEATVQTVEELRRSSRANRLRAIS